MLQIASPTVELTLVNQLRKQVPIISLEMSDILRLARVGNEVVRQKQGQPFAIRERRLGACFACQQAFAFGFVPIINNDLQCRQQRFHI